MVRLCLVLVVTATCLMFTQATVYFLEQFDEHWPKRWVYTEATDKPYKKFDWTAGKLYHDPYKDRGLQTTEGSSHYAISARFNKSFTNEGVPLVLQFTVKHEQQLDCGGGYIKLLNRDFSQRNLNPHTPYLIMFGPDICRYGVFKYKVQAILHHNKTNFENKNTITCAEDHYSHLYTLILRPDNTYEIKMDNVRQAYADLEDDYLPNKEVYDHDAPKPKDWDDRPQIEDPAQKKPARKTPDPNAKKPLDWDDEINGIWKAPLILNPAYDSFKPQLIDNPNYKGFWFPPMKRNPVFKSDRNFYRFFDVSAVAIEVWQSKPGTLFDNLLVTDDPEFAAKFGEETWRKSLDGEREMERTVSRRNEL